MRLRLAASTLVGATTVAAALLVATPAQADTCVTPDPCDTEVTFEVLAGDLQITVPDDVALTNDSPPGGYAFGQLGPVLVEDLRAESGVGWTASVISTDFTTDDGADPGETIDSGNVLYCSGPATATTGSGTFTPGQAGPCTPPPAGGVPLDTEQEAFSHGTDGVGNNTATWNPLLSVNIPLATIAGEFTGTITHSVV
ncbi:hypothetical protein [Micromonospora sp. WMMD1082]|uniref:hypothetical protein n=1 Tax=Micromonospora sp. WMMD1082 TaxID=3016104 RepID=UPI002416C925|nr:hypothetical protein [Micromonospora sp. WMMD1082]MDG4798577.1 hypothetical protein [Micromonospora sp. WMMD1082]